MAATPAFSHALLRTRQVFPMNWRTYLFSHQGRVGRREYWLIYLLSLPFVAAAIWINGGIDHDPTEPPGVFALVPTMWSGVVVQIKRWHDRDKSGWWSLINLIPFVGAIWSFVENGCLKGASGPNRFGADPLEPKTDAWRRRSAVHRR